MPEEDKAKPTVEKDSEFKETLVKMVTVFAYVSSVSMGAMVLSSYYIFFWEPKPPSPDPPVIHPHAYMSDPMPPLKLVSQDTHGSSFWESVVSYFQSKDDETTRLPLPTMISTVSDVSGLDLSSTVANSTESSPRTKETNENSTMVTPVYNLTSSTIYKIITHSKEIQDGSTTSSIG